MNEGRDVWSGGNMAERSAEIRKSLKQGFNRYKGGELFPKKIPPTEIELMEKELEKVQDEIDKERVRRRGEEIVEKTGTSEAEKKEGDTESPFASGSLVGKTGNSEGAKKGWETRRRGGAAPKKFEVKYDPARDTPGLKNVTPEQAGDIDRKGSTFEEELTFAEGRLKRGKDAVDSIEESFGHAKNLLDAVAGHIDEEARKSFLQRLESIKEEGVEYDENDQSQKEALASLRKLESDIADHVYETDEERRGKVIASKSLSDRLNEVARKHLGASFISKDMVEKILKDGGWDRLPLTDKAREIVEDMISKGAEPVTEYTGKLLVERAIPEEPPAFVRPKKLKVGDKVIPLHWTVVGTQGAKFDLPNVPEAVKVKKMYMGPAKVTKNSYPYGRYPKDISKAETVTEDRLWGLEIEDRLGKQDGDDTMSLPVTTRDTTLVVRLPAMASPEGEVNTGDSVRD